MSIFRHYRRDGTLYPTGEEGMLEWGRDVGDMSKKVVKQETLPNGYFVSTVWLGLDMSMSLTLGHAPLIFETMVFDRGEKDSPWHDLYCKRYATEREAKLGHNEIARKWKKARHELLGAPINPNL